MKKYNVTVNGTVYEVYVEEAGEVASAPVAVAAPVRVAAPAPAPVATPAPAAVVTGGVKIEAPMGGAVTKVLVKVGDTVKAGDTLITFEAMKMEQEIKAPQDGTVASVNVSQGASMNQGDLLVSLN